MADYINIAKENLDGLKHDITEIKKEYPDIDTNPDSHDGSYELVREIIKQYREEIDNSSEWGANDVTALYYATTFVKNDIKIEKISKTNLKNKEKFKQFIQNLNKKLKDRKYTNNIDKVKVSNFGMFRSVSGGFGDNINANATEEDLRNFIIFCTEIIDEKDNNIIYDKFENNICSKISNGNISIGILSQILHCLKPNTFPILNSSGLKFYQKALNIKMQSEKGREVEINSGLKNYIKAINAIKENIKGLEFNNYRILDIIAQKYYFDFSDKNINKFLTNYAGKSTTKVPMVGDCGEIAYKDFQSLEDKFLSLLKETNEKANKEFDYKKTSHRWNLGYAYINHFWVEFKREKYEKLPYSISLFAESNESNKTYLRINIEYKGKPDEESPQIYNNWLPNDIDGFTKLWSKESKLVKIINGPFEYATSKNFIEQILNAFIKLEPEYNELCNMALGNVVPATKPTEESEEGKTMQKFPLNLILYGPPGTGKTYNTVVKAMSIIHDKKYEYDIKNDYYTNDKDDTTITYKELLNEYQNEIAKKSNDISKRIEFVTFHQSYSYEEFVEGIKPELDSENLKYTIENGVFKRICHRAENPIIKNGSNNLGLNENPKIWKVSLKKAGDNPIRKDCMKNNHIRIGFDKYGEFITDETVFDDGGIRVLPAFIDKMEIGDIVLSCYSEKTIDAIGVIASDYYWNEKANDYKRYRDVKWLKKGLNYNILKINNDTKFTGGTIYQLNNITVKDVLDIVDEQKNTKSYEENQKPYVLIIDEINRGNISKIFGELITLIEEDKRAGNDNALTVTLPYSQDPFSVPKNLYIIGTMNTADRSIALLDTALRRRFDFEEVPPNEELLENKVANSINLQNVLTNLNNNIVDEKIGGLDKNYKIGHAFFINVNKGNSKEQEEKLKRAFLNKIYPLLEEYFYDDEEKIAKVLCCNDEDGKKLLKDIRNNWQEILKKLADGYNKDTHED